MRIAIGTKNIIKIQAVEEVIVDYAVFQNAKIETFGVPSGVSEQPLSMEEIIRGAKNRAHNAFKECQGCSYSFGIESGLFQAEGSLTGFLEACICCIFDGKSSHVGLSCGFEVPPKILNLIKNKKMDLNEACFEEGLTQNRNLGSAEGFISLLTKGRINRKEYTKQCVITALIQIEHATLYTGQI